MSRVLEVPQEEDTDVLHRRTSTVIAVLPVAEAPVKRLATTLLAVVVGEGVCPDESNETVKLADLNGVV
jgi:hypothetical protein